MPAESRRPRVIITEIRTTDTDTGIGIGIGDVYEAAARAVWRALQLTTPAYAGFSEPEIIDTWLRDRIGLRPAGVTEARHWHGDRRGPDADSLIRTRRPLRVVGEVLDREDHSPEVLQAMRDHLDKLKQLGIEAMRH